MYFVAWQDRRAGSDWDIWGTRVDVNGVPLDPAGIAISEASRAQLSPRVAAGDGQFLVAWEDERNASSDTIMDFSEVYAARVTSGGALLDPAGIAITSDQNDDQTPEVASDGTDYLIVWRDHGSFGNDKILGTRLDPAGTVLGASPISIASTGDLTGPSVVFGGGQYLAAWAGGQGVRAARVSTAGAVVDPAPGMLVAPEGTTSG